jgi:hypothetical protein
MFINEYRLGRIGAGWIRVQEGTYMDGTIERRETSTPENVRIRVGLIFSSLAPVP